MELENIVHMKGGKGKSSYAKTSYVGAMAISMTRPIREATIVELLEGMEFQNKTTLYIAELGCATGQNTFTIVLDFITLAEKLRGKMKWGNIEYQVYLNDLPKNDFNTLFDSLPIFENVLKQEVGVLGSQFFVTAVPGSFYGRLFPRKSLDFAHSSYCLYWLSQVPMGLEDNRRNIYISTMSPKSVVDAYRQQFHKDSQIFLKSRSEEMKEGGRMVLTYWGRSSDSPTNMETCMLFWEILANILNELVSMGIVEAEKLESFNVPVYYASAAEIIEEVKIEGSFYINVVDVSQMSGKGTENNNNDSTMKSFGSPAKAIEDPSKLLRAVFESIIASHFGEAIADEVFGRLNSMAASVVTKYDLLLTNITISMTKL